MKITFASVYANDESHHLLTIESDKGEIIKVGQEIPVELWDRTVRYYPISGMKVWRKGENKGKWIPVEEIRDGETCEADVYGIEGIVHTTSEPSFETVDYYASLKSIFPKHRSLTELVDPAFAAPDKLIAYMRAANYGPVAPGIMNNPFREGCTYHGPYLKTDGRFIWEASEWKYVYKYHVKPTDEFIDYVMSGEGDSVFIDAIEENRDWSDAIKEYKKRLGYKAFLPSHSELKCVEEYY